jgi:hypothetical protein
VAEEELGQQVRGALQFLRILEVEVFRFGGEEPE